MFLNKENSEFLWYNIVCRVLQFWSLENNKKRQVKRVEKGKKRTKESIGFRKEKYVNIYPFGSQAMFRTEYYSINDNRIKEVRMRNKEIAKNYCEFLKYWLENGKNKMTDIELTYEIITHKEKSKNNYNEYSGIWRS